jgi:hypothetical protein
LAAAQLTASQTFTGTQTFLPSSTTTVGLVAKAISSQTSDLQQWQSTASAVLAKITKDGDGYMRYISTKGTQTSWVTPTSYTGSVMYSDLGNAAGDFFYQTSALTLIPGLAADIDSGDSLALAIHSAGQSGTANRRIVMYPSRIQFLSSSGTSKAALTETALFGINSISANADGSNSVLSLTNSVGTTPWFTINSVGAALFGSVPFAANTQTAAGRLLIGNSTAPTGTPSSSGILFVESGALKYKGSSGTVTTIANA